MKYLLLLLLSGCVSADVMLGTKIKEGGFYGSGPTVTLRLQRPITDRVWCEYEHVSFLVKGPPFGPREDEDSLDQIGCGVSFGR